MTDDPQYTLPGVEQQRGLVPAILRYLDTRIGLAPFLSILRKKEVPIHRHTVWYYVGGITLIFFVM